MEVFCWSIELPDPSYYGLTLELKPKQKAEDSIIARAQQGGDAIPRNLAEHGSSRNNSFNCLLCLMRR